MLKKLDDCCKKGNTNINYTKTKRVTFSKENRKEIHMFTINSQVIENSTACKYLGITVQKNCLFKSHLDDLACRANKALFLMKP